MPKKRSRAARPKRAKVIASIGPTLLEVAAKLDELESTVVDLVGRVQDLEDRLEFESGAVADLEIAAEEATRAKPSPT